MQESLPNTLLKMVVSVTFLKLLALLIADLLQTGYADNNPLLSTVSEKSVETINIPFSNEKERCVAYFNSQLSDFLQKWKRPSSKVRTNSS